MDVKCCRRQHEVLVACIRYALQCWGSLDDDLVSYWIDDTVTPWQQSSRIRLTPELKRVLTRARTLSEDCYTELPLLEAILRHADRSQTFIDIVKEIQWCTSVVYNGNNCRHVTRVSAPELQDFSWQAKIGHHEKFLLENAEQEDWQQLMLELQNYYDRHDECNAEECGNTHALVDPYHCLATQAMHRFFFQESNGSNHLDHKSMLWSFNPEVVKHGRPLGSGAFGLVSKVTWLGSKYARKIYNAVGLHSLPAEAKALAELNHPHIVKVYAYSEDSLLMDLMSSDLHKFMIRRMKEGTRDEPFSLPAAMDLMLQIADAVSYLHSQNVTHRDLKSSNILVNPVNTPGLEEVGEFVFAKIADFGMAKTKREITRYSHLTHNVGTKVWMAPEIFGANVQDDHLELAFPMKADVYSFGIICFEILTGQQPFSDEPLTTLYSKLTAPIPLRPQLPSSCPTNLASLIYECWDTDPRKRPTFVDVCRVLRYLKGLPTLLVWNDAQPDPMDGRWPFGRLTPKIKKQGPWGASNNFEKDTIIMRDGPSIGMHGSWRASYKPQEDFYVAESLGDIRGVKFLFADLGKRCLSGFNYHITGFLDKICIGGGGSGSGGGSSNWIWFDPSEFLVQIEGSISSELGVVSLSFITTRQKYGPYGNVFIQGTKSFRSNRGRVVGFTGVLQSFEVYTIPNIAQCLRQYLINKESII